MADSAPSSSFHPFPSLPTEIRLAIWELCLPPTPRLVPLFSRSIPDPHFQQQTTDQETPPQLQSITTTCPAPTLLHVNREARTIASSRYAILFAFPSPNLGFSTVWFDCTSDILYLSRDSFRDDIALYRNYEELLDRRGYDDEDLVYMGWSEVMVIFLLYSRKEDLGRVENLALDFHDPFLEVDFSNRRQEPWIAEALWYFDGAKYLYDVGHLPMGHRVLEKMSEYFTDEGGLVFWGGEGEGKETSLGLSGWPSVLSIWHYGLKNQTNREHDMVRGYRVPPSSAHNIDMRALEREWDEVVSRETEYMSALERKWGNLGSGKAEFAAVSAVESDDDPEPELLVTEITMEDADTVVEGADSGHENASHWTGNSRVRRFCDLPRIEFRTVMTAGTKILLEDLSDKFTEKLHHEQRLRALAQGTGHELET